jgi:hypothetical protein
VERGRSIPTADGMKYLDAVFDGITTWILLMERQKPRT